MVAREPHPSAQTLESVAEFLNDSPHAMRDRKFGPGVRFSLAGVESPGMVELFGDSAVVRLTTPNLQLTLQNMDRLEVSADEMIFSWAADDGSGYDAAIARSGEIRLVAPGRPSAVSEQAVPEPTPEAPSAERPEQERLTFLGRVGSNIAFRTTAKGVLVARFPMAVRMENGDTTWETVIAFGDKAEKLRDSVQRGDAIEIVGYAHAREVQRRDGSNRTVREIYAAVVKPR